MRAVAYGESDSVVTLLTQTVGKLGVMVRGARKSQKRFAGALEPFHTIEVTLDDKGGDLGVLREARIVTIRHGILARLEALDAAGAALRWARHLFQPRTPEPQGWSVLLTLLDALDQGACPPRAALAAAGLGLLGIFGYALDFERCVQCAKACPENRVAFVDVSRGGLVCRTCGGSARTIAADVRAVASALQRGEDPEMSAAQMQAVLALIDDAMAAHAGYDPARKSKG